MIPPSVISWSAPAPVLSASEDLRRSSSDVSSSDSARSADRKTSPCTLACAGSQDGKGGLDAERQMHVRGEIARERRQRLLSGGRERVDVVQDERHVVRSGDHDLVAERLDLVNDLAIEIDARAETREALPERRAHMGEQPRTGRVARRRSTIPPGRAAPPATPPAASSSRSRRPRPPRPLPPRGPRSGAAPTPPGGGDEAEAAAAAAASAVRREQASLSRPGGPLIPAGEGPRSRRPGASAHRRRAPRP